MLAYIKVIPQEDWQIIRKYLTDNDYEGTVVLIPEELANDQLKKVNPEQSHDYDVDASDVDMYVDVVRSKEHPFFKSDLYNKLS